MSVKRGVAALFLVGVFAFVFVIANVVVYFFIGVVAKETENLFFIEVSTNERGKEMKVFLASENDDKYINILGSLIAEGGDVKYEAIKQDMVNDLRYMDKKCMLVYKGLEIDNPIKKLGNCPDDNNEQDAQIADIPIPGARESENRVKVRIE